jgi:uncharacterized metal-binding protein YceD (DUF177 family)
LRPLKKVLAVNTQDLILNIYSIKLGEHQFQYKIGKEFTDLYDEDLAEAVSVSVQLDLRKAETMVEMDFHLEGTADLVCDRSLDIYTEELQSNRKLILKYGEERDELSDEIVVIPHEQHEVDIAQLIYEFIALAIPMKRLHPDFREDLEAEEGEQILIYSSREDLDENENEQKEQLDPRWEALKHIKKN